MSTVNKHSLKLILAVGFGGMIGALLRYVVSLFVKMDSATFPIDTLIVNICGSFLLAFILTLSIYKLKVDNSLLAFLSTGIIGSFTTFSTIMIDFTLLIEQHLFFAFIYLLMTIVLGLFTALIGFFIGKRI